MAAFGDCNMLVVHEPRRSIRQLYVDSLPTSVPGAARYTNYQSLSYFSQYSIRLPKESPHFAQASLQLRKQEDGRILPPIVRLDGYFTIALSCISERGAVGANVTYILSACERVVSGLSLYLIPPCLSTYIRQASLAVRNVPPVRPVLLLRHVSSMISGTDTRAPLAWILKSVSGTPGNFSFNLASSFLLSG